MSERQPSSELPASLSAGIENSIEQTGLLQVARRAGRTASRLAAEYEVKHLPAHEARWQAWVGGVVEPLSEDISNWNFITGYKALARRIPTEITYQGTAMPVDIDLVFTGELSALKKARDDSEEAHELGGLQDSEKKSRAYDITSLARSLGMRSPARSRFGFPYFDEEALRSMPNLADQRLHALRPFSRHVTGVSFSIYESDGRAGKQALDRGVVTEAFVDDPYAELATIAIDFGLDIIRASGRVATSSKESKLKATITRDRVETLAARPAFTSETGDEERIAEAEKFIGEVVEKDLRAADTRNQLADYVLGLVVTANIARLRTDAVSAR
ncbi:MAG: hypothetical protein WA843_02625 [Candidatus Saccharimonadales bacterium]